MTDPTMPHPLHPIAVAALAANGITPDHVLNAPIWLDGRTLSYGDIGRGKPRVTCSRDSLRVYHPVAPDGTQTMFVMHELIEHGRPQWLHEIDVREFFPPETTLTAMVGRSVADVVDLPGSDRILIERAHLCPKGLVLRLHHPEVST